MEFQPEVLEQARLGKGLTLQEVADKMDLKTPSIWRWENGKAVPRPAHLKKLAKILGVSVKQLTTPVQEEE